MPDARQFVAVGLSGDWAGTLTVLVEEAGTQDWAGFPVERAYARCWGRPAAAPGASEVDFVVAPV